MATSVPIPRIRPLEFELVNYVKKETKTNHKLNMHRKRRFTIFDA